MKHFGIAMVVFTSVWCSSASQAAEQTGPQIEGAASTLACPHCGKAIDRAQLRDSIRQRLRDRLEGAEVPRWGERLRGRDSRGLRAFKGQREFNVPGAKRKAPGAIFRRHFSGPSAGQPQWRRAMPGTQRSWRPDFQPHPGLRKLAPGRPRQPANPNAQ